MKKENRSEIREDFVEKAVDLMFSVVNSTQIKHLKTPKEEATNSFRLTHPNIYLPTTTAELLINE